MTLVSHLSSQGFLLVFLQTDDKVQDTGRNRNNAGECSSGLQDVGLNG